MRSLAGLAMPEFQVVDELPLNSEWMIFPTRRLSRIGLFGPVSQHNRDLFVVFAVFVFSIGGLFHL